MPCEKSIALKAVNKLEIVDPKTFKCKRSMQRRSFFPVIGAGLLPLNHSSAFAQITKPVQHTTMPYEIIIGSPASKPEGLAIPKEVAFSKGLKDALNNMEVGKFKLTSTVPSSVLARTNTGDFIEFPVVVYTFEKPRP
jgi:hypothetical protein